MNILERDSHHAVYWILLFNLATIFNQDVGIGILGTTFVFCGILLILDHVFDLR